MMETMSGWVSGCSSSYSNSEYRNYHSDCVYKMDMVEPGIVMEILILIFFLVVVSHFQLSCSCHQSFSCSCQFVLEAVIMHHQLLVSLLDVLSSPLLLSSFSYTSSVKERIKYVYQ